MRRVDKSGQQFGSLVVLRRDENNSKYWHCVCLLCGGSSVNSGNNLVSGHTKSCGCLRRTFKDETGKVYGNVIVLSPSEKTDSYRSKYWRCQCMLCSKVFDVVGKSLRQGKTKSCGCSWSKPTGIAAKNALITSYRKSARVRGIEYSLTDEQFEEITKRKCVYCGIDPCKVVSSHRFTNGNYTYNGIDRVNSDIGYVSGNCVPCCSVCNYAKRDMTKEQFIEWIRRVYANIGNTEQKNIST